MTSGINNAPFHHSTPVQDREAQNAQAPTNGTHPATGGLVQCISGDSRPTVQDHLPSGAAPQALQEALIHKPSSPLQERKVARTGDQTIASPAPVASDARTSASSPSPGDAWSGTQAIFSEIIKSQSDKQTVSGVSASIDVSRNARAEDRVRN